MLPKRPRIQGFPYVGFHRYSLIICTRDRESLFRDARVVTPVLTTIRQCAATCDFAVFAYCFMPDHLHLIVSATADSADLRAFISRWKQRAGYEHRQRTGQFLWQPSYFDHVLRDEEEMQRAVRYVLDNPIRKGLVTEFTEYPFSGSDVFSVEELRGFWERKGITAGQG
jgi:putative transposase